MSALNDIQELLKVCNAKFKEGTPEHEVLLIANRAYLSLNISNTILNGPIVENDTPSRIMRICNVKPVTERLY